MPASNVFLYGPANLAIQNGTIDLDGDSYRMVLLTDAYTPNQSAHSAFSDLSAAEVANGNGYTTGGEAITLSVTSTGLVVTVDGTDVSWPASTITAKYAAIVRDANGDNSLDAGDVPVFYVDLETGGGSVSSTSAAFNVNVNASGLYTFTAAAA